ncbi:MAG: hypothetical protein KF699_07820 [Phycisphaeraceae bacterium]|nr:hypothetical protein [Phycisphaeraceae bacterium]
MRAQHQKPRVVALAALLAAGGVAGAQPTNNTCAAAPTIAPGQSVQGTLAGATTTGACSCAAPGGRDVYYRLVAAAEGVHSIRLCDGQRWDSALSVHAGCAATIVNEWACDDEGCRAAGAPGFGFHGRTAVFLRSFETCIIRVAAYDPSVPPAAFTLAVDAPPPLLGACCVGGECLVVTAEQCAAAIPGGGVFLGAASSCIGAGAVIAQPSVHYGTGQPIPDGDPAGFSSSLAVSAQGEVGGVEVWLAMDHPYIGDLRVTLSHGGATMPLLARVGGGELGDQSPASGEYRFRDADGAPLWFAARTATGGAAVEPGVYRATDEHGAVQRLSGAFAGLAAAGDWTLTVADEIPLGAGILRGWGLVIRGSTGPRCGEGVGACCIGIGVCIPYTRGECELAGGVFEGADIPCQDVPGNSLGCCVANFDGVDGVTPADIFAFLSAWFAADSRADIDGDGQVLTADIGLFLSLWFNGCNVRSPGGVGACCLPPVLAGLGITCAQRGQASCLLAGGTWRGEAVPCEQSAGNPVACCRANFDAMNGVGPPDLFAYLSAWFAGLPAADVTGNGAVEIADLFAFLAAYFVGCP